MSGATGTSSSCSPANLRYDPNVAWLRPYGGSEGAGVGRAIVAAVWFRAQDERYQWFNYHMCVGEGEIDEQTRVWWFNISAVVNEVAIAPPKIAWAHAPWS